MKYLVKILDGPHKGKYATLLDGIVYVYTGIGIEQINHDFEVVCELP